MGHSCLQWGTFLFIHELDYSSVMIPDHGKLNMKTFWSTLNNNIYRRWATGNKCQIKSSAEKKNAVRAIRKSWQKLRQNRVNIWFEEPFGMFRTIYYLKSSLSHSLNKKSVWALLCNYWASSSRDGNLYVKLGEYHHERDKLAIHHPFPPLLSHQTISNYHFLVSVWECLPFFLPA